MNTTVIVNVKKLIEYYTNYDVPGTDDDFLLYLSSEVEQHIKNDLNVEAVPEGLVHIWERLVTGKYLQVKKVTLLELEEVDLSGVESIKEGDTTVSFGNGGSNPKVVQFDILLKFLLKECDFACYRKLRW